MRWTSSTFSTSEANAARAALLATSIAAAILAPQPAAAHSWYPWSCCSDRDCKPVEATAVRFTEAGWLIERTGETIPFEKARVSPDGRYHICSAGGNPDGRTICLFTPGTGS
ncbi:hypothetical protein [Lutibaculum baratangense]|uniref:Secreted protein n=1 Tax=Lutibaculum baratangense AMV1 TaxID=631454 RepID=V4RHM2_9HYPH|nr:hypothetical protein [Lutibaculum baratangense]ESR24844.1 hypothetical protein N177_2167 [Lutibaculum baratangense AMV1]